MATTARPTPNPRLSRPIIAALVGLTWVTIVPYLVGGPGLFLDDWQLAQGMHDRGLWGIGRERFLSRPGSWLVYTALYGTLHGNAWAWAIVLNLLFTGCAVLLFAALARFVSQPVAGVVVATWILLPDHLSMRVWPAISNVDVAVMLVCAVVLLLDDRRVIAAGLVGVVATSMYELVAPVTVLAIIVLGLRRGTRRDVGIAVALVVAMTGLMALHPTYPSMLFTYSGTPYRALQGLFGEGLTTLGPVAWALVAISVAGTGFAGLCWARGDRAAGSGPWLVGVGWAIIIAGLASLAFHMPSASAGTSDRLFTVSTVGAAMVWVGIGRVVLDRSRPLAAVLAAAWVVAIGGGALSHQRDWSTVAKDARDVVLAVDRRYDGTPPTGLVVGPEPPRRGGVVSITEGWRTSATQIITGRTVVFRLADDPAEFEAARGPKLTVDELLDDRSRPR